MNSMLAAFAAAAENVKVRENIVTNEYKVMYFFAGWHTAETIYAEDDSEAIYDAEHYEMSDKLTYALFCGNRLVKKLNYSGNPYKTAV